MGGEEREGQGSAHCMLSRARNRAHLEVARGTWGPMEAHTLPLEEATEKTGGSCPAPQGQ